MKIALLGYGKMGKAIERIALERGHEIVLKKDQNNTFEGLLNDYNGTVGLRSKINDWNIDVSFTTGGNAQTYMVGNSHNRNKVYAPRWNPDTNLFEPVELYRENSPVAFNPGGTSFSHNVGNIDISRVLSDKISIGIGSEMRAENFEIISGERRFRAISFLKIKFCFQPQFPR
mgnify:CR=1 FL=1